MFETWRKRLYHTMKGQGFPDWYVLSLHKNKK